MKEIKLSKNKYALIDDDNYDYLIQWKWHCLRGGKYYYAARKEKNRYINKYITILMHREILNVPHNMFVDHIDHNTLNNQKNNIRICTRSQNYMNRTPFGRSKYLGVWQFQNGFRAGIKHKDKVIDLGCFKNEINAALAYDKAAKKYHGEFANLNFKNILPGSEIIEWDNNYK